jgi:hypothetical protein
MLNACPGAGVIREPRPRYVVCPHCDTEVEIWTDEYRRRCQECNAWVYRTQGSTCLDWCAKAKECVGTATLKQYQKARARAEAESE